MLLFNLPTGLFEHEAQLVLNLRFEYNWIVTVQLTFLMFVGWKVWDEYIAAPTIPSTKGG